MLTVPVALIAPVPVFALQEATAPPMRVAPVLLPDVSLSDAAYKTQLSALFADPAKRPGLYVSLYNLIERETPPPHADVIVAQLMPFVSGSNAVEAIVPLKVLGMCGAAARPAASKVMLLATSPVDKVRLAAVEALGGMFYAPQGVAPSAPVAVTTQLVR
ncbi:MAG: hypothetical protein H7Y38_16230, partial [Armatimonadetes bacterium]|nr:hypothetical protein [Armatimonadota bacterium]